MTTSDLGDCTGEIKISSIPRLICFICMQRPENRKRLINITMLMYLPGDSLQQVCETGTKHQQPTCYLLTDVAQS